MTKEYIIKTLANKGYKLIYLTCGKIIARGDTKSYNAKSLSKLYKLIKS